MMELLEQHLSYLSKYAIDVFQGSQHVQDIFFLTWLISRSIDYSCLTKIKRHSQKHTAIFLNFSLQLVVSLPTATAKFPVSNLRVLKFKLEEFSFINTNVLE